MISNFEGKQVVLLICLIGIVGSAAAFVNSLYANANAMIAAAVGTGMFVLFVFLTAEILVVNLKNAILDQKQKDNDELLAVVISKAVYRSIKEEKDKE